VGRVRRSHVEVISHLSIDSPNFHVLLLAELDIMFYDKSTDTGMEVVYESFFGPLPVPKVVKPALLIRLVVYPLTNERSKR
jgi:hypothetical protein